VSQRAPMNLYSGVQPKAKVFPPFSIQRQFTRA
jgi:hypothetical protein